MAKVLDNCLYNKIKLLHELSCILWFIEKHAEQDAKAAGHDQCHKFLEELEADLEKHIKNLKTMLCK